MLIRLINMIGIDMRIPERMDKFSRLKTGRLRHHHSEQGIRSDVERNAEENIGTPLIEFCLLYTSDAADE